MSYKYGDEGTAPLDLKFNSGRGALLCHCCKVMAEGFEHEGKTYECECGSLYQIVRLNTADVSVYTFGHLIINEAN